MQENTATIRKPDYTVRLYSRGEETTSNFKTAQAWLMAKKVAKLPKSWPEDPPNHVNEPIVAYLTKTNPNGSTSALQLALSHITRIPANTATILEGRVIHPQEHKDEIFNHSVVVGSFRDAPITAFYIDGTYYDYALTANCHHDHVVDADDIRDKILRGAKIFATGGYVQTSPLISLINDYTFQTITGEVYAILH